MRYENLLKKLYQKNRKEGMKYDLTCVQTLSRALHYPEKAYPTIHIAGSNGKGSVACKIAEGLRLAGLTVGLYTSPHIRTFRERMVINGMMISKKRVVKDLSTLLKLSSSLQLEPTFFEITTILAFYYFKHENVDVAVIETGLGGRLDATNIVLPLLSVITTIEYDHTEILGHTLEEIAGEKAGIIKPKTPVVVGPKAQLSPIFFKAQQEKAPIICSSIEGKNYDEENQNIAKVALKQLSKHFLLSNEKIQRALAKVPSCRFERIQYRGVDVILDVAHNPGAFERLFKALVKTNPHASIHVLFSQAQDKDIASTLMVIKKYAKMVYLSPFKHLRLASHTTLIKMMKGAKEMSYCVGATLKESFDQAVLRAQEEGGVVLVCGSFYIMDEVKTLMMMKNTHPVSLVQNFFAYVKQCFFFKKGNLVRGKPRHQRW